MIVGIFSPVKPLRSLVKTCLLPLPLAICCPHSCPIDPNGEIRPKKSVSVTERLYFDEEVRPAFHEGLFSVQNIDTLFIFVQTLYTHVAFNIILLFNCLTEGSRAIVIIVIIEYLYSGGSICGSRIMNKNITWTSAIRYVCLYLCMFIDQQQAK